MTDTPEGAPSKRAMEVATRMNAVGALVNRPGMAILDAEFRKGEELAKAAIALDDAYTSPSAGNNDRGRAWGELRRVLRAYRGS